MDSEGFIGTQRVRGSARMLKSLSGDALGELVVVEG
jgi:hypothetical protein